MTNGRPGRAGPIGRGSPATGCHTAVMTEIPVPEAGSTPRPAPDAARSMGVAQLVLYGLLTVLFLTPFITVSFGRGETEPVSGFDLVTLQDPMIFGSPGDGIRSDIMEVVDGARRMAAILAVLLTVGSVVALLGVLHGPGPGVSRSLFAVSYLTVIGYCAVILGVGTNVPGPDIHHGSGLTGSTGVAVLVLFLAFATLRSALAPCQQAGRSSPAAIALWTALGGWPVLAVAAANDSGAVGVVTTIAWLGAAAVALLAAVGRASIAGLVGSLVAGLPLSMVFGMLVSR